MSISKRMDYINFVIFHISENEWITSRQMTQTKWANNNNNLQMSNKVWPQIYVVQKHAKLNTILLGVKYICVKIVKNTKKIVIQDRVITGRERQRGHTGEAHTEL